MKTANFLSLSLVQSLGFSILRDGGGELNLEPAAAD